MSKSVRIHTGLDVKPSPCVWTRIGSNFILPDAGGNLLTLLPAGVVRERTWPLCAAVSPVRGSRSSWSSDTGVRLSSFRSTSSHNLQRKSIILPSSVNLSPDPKIRFGMFLSWIFDPDPVSGFFPSRNLDPDTGSRGQKAPDPGSDPQHWATVYSVIQREGIDLILTFNKIFLSWHNPLKNSQKDKNYIYWSSQKFFL
jgi:hypothetical protein